MHEDSGLLTIPNTDVAFIFLPERAHGGRYLFKGDWQVPPTPPTLLVLFLYMPMTPPCVTHVAGSLGGREQLSMSHSMVGQTA